MVVADRTNRKAVRQCLKRASAPGGARPMSQMPLPAPFSPAAGTPMTSRGLAVAAEPMCAPGSCRDCTQLAAYLANPLQSGEFFTVSKARRQHLHQVGQGRGGAGPLYWAWGVGRSWYMASDPLPLVTAATFIWLTGGGLRGKICSGAPLASECRE